MRRPIKKKVGRKKNALGGGVSSEAHKLYVIEENSTSGNRMWCGGDPAGSGKTLASCDVAETIRVNGSNLWENATILGGMSSAAA